MKFNSIAQSSLVVLSARARPRPQLRRRGASALLHRGERRLWQQWWHDFRRAQLHLCRMRANAHRGRATPRPAATVILTTSGTSLPFQR